MESSASQTPDYSIVIPVYFNEGSLITTMTSLKEQVIDANPELICEVIFVDDGSGDGSLPELLELHKRYPGLVKVVKLTRNFGQVNAWNAGFHHARGRCVVVISADGQDPVALINQMLAEFADGTEIVIATREDREESRFRVLTSRIFYRLM